MGFIRYTKRLRRQAPTSRTAQVEPRMAAGVVKMDGSPYGRNGSKDDELEEMFLEMERDRAQAEARSAGGNAPGTAVVPARSQEVQPAPVPAPVPVKASVPQTPSSGAVEIDLDGEEVVASHFEARKTRMSMDGAEWKLTLTVRTEDLPMWLANARIGTRLQMAVVALTDDEQPVKRSKSAGEKLLQKAHVLVRDQDFIKFLMTRYDPKGMIRRALAETHSDQKSREAAIVETVSEVLRQSIGVVSRADLKHDPDAQDRFNGLVHEYARDYRK